MLVISLVKRKSQNFIELVKYRFISSCSGRGHPEPKVHHPAMIQKRGTTRKSYKYKFSFMIKLKSYL